MHAADLRQQLQAIYDSHRYWPEPLIQINRNYRVETDVAKLVAEGALNPLL